MQALILAAGLGSRLEGNGKPKALLEVGGRPILDRQLETLERMGIDRICLVTGYGFAHLEKRYGERVDYRYNPFYRSSNNLVSFLFARDWIDDDLLVLYADLLYESGVIEVALTSAVSFGLVVDRTAIEPNHAMFEIEDGAVVRIGTRLSPGAAGARHVGIGVFSRRGLQKLLPELESAAKAGRIHDYYHVAMQPLIQSGHRVAAIDVSGLRWMEIDSREDLERARREWG